MDGPKLKIPLQKLITEQVKNADMSYQIRLIVYQRKAKIALKRSYAVLIQRERLHRQNSPILVSVQFTNIERKERVKHEKIRAIQHLHMLFSGSPDRKWKENETKLSELVFIGKDLNKEELEQQFKNCIAN